MLFMSVATYEPNVRDEIIKRRLEKGGMIPEGVKLLGEWSCISGGRVFRLVETDDPEAAIEGVLAWSDLCKVELHPVLVSEEAVEVIKKT